MARMLPGVVVTVKSPVVVMVKVRLKVTTQGKVRHEDERLVELPARKVLRGDPGKNLPEKDEPG